MEIRRKDIQAVSQMIQKKSKYSQIDARFVEHLAQNELEKGRSVKDAVKAVASKLHQVAGAYFVRPPLYELLHKQIRNLPAEMDSPETQAFCREVMASHSSTRERLPILERFFSETLETIAPVSSILDLACGMNPLALPWMPVRENVSYYGCDIYTDLVDLLTVFSKHFGIQSDFSVCNLIDMTFKHTAKVAFLLKTLPCLEQLEKGIEAELLETIPADFLLISYPIRSLGGRSKGMRKNYEQQFWELVKGRGWQVTQYEFPDELAFLVKK